MSFKDLFIERVDNTSKPQQPQAKAAKPVATPMPLPTPKVTPEAQSYGEVNQNIVNQVWEAIKNENLPGPDYLELKHNASSLDGMPLTEEQKIQAAFKMLKSNFPNFTKSIITNSIDKYLEVVERERKMGLDEYENTKTAQVGSREAEIERLRAESDEIVKKIENLKAEYAKKNDAIAVLTQEVTSTSQELDKTKAVFLNSVDSVATLLNNDKEKINQINFE